MELETLTQSDKVKLGSKTIVQMIRGQIKTAFPNMKFSLTQEHYAGGWSVHLSILQSPVRMKLRFDELSDKAKFRYGDDGRRSLEQLKSMQESDHHQLGHLISENYDPNTWNNGVFLTKEGHSIMQKIIKIINHYNYDNSDAMTDYFDVNFYVHLNLGKWDKPFIDGVD